MKKTFILALFVMGIITQAQENILIETPWFLHKLEHNGEVFPTPVNSESDYEFNGVNFMPDGYVAAYTPCNYIHTVALFNMEEQDFQVISNWNNPEENECNLQENRDFEEMYFQEFWGINDEGTSGEVFSYDTHPAGSGNEGLALTITNESGWTAYFDSHLLSTKDISNPDDFQIVFHQNDLIIKNQKSENYKSVLIYDLSGELLMNAPYPKNQNLNTSGLKKGIYIVQIIGENGNKWSKKVVKP